MINHIHIKGFESHKDTRIEMSETLTIISGASDCGKSGIMRAARWCLLNESDGDSFIPHGAKRGHMTEVEIRVNSKHTVRRKRSRSDNLYELDGEEYRAFGTNVPEPIAEVFGLSPLVSQAQADGHFGLSYTGGENARLINSVIALDSIDKAHAEARQFKTHNDRDILTTERNVKDLTDKLNKLEVWVPLRGLFEVSSGMNVVVKTGQANLELFESDMLSLDSLKPTTDLIEPVWPTKPTYDSNIDRAIEELNAVKNVVSIDSVTFPTKPEYDDNIDDSIVVLRKICQVFEIDDIKFPVVPSLDSEINIAIADLKRLPPVTYLTEPEWPDRPNPFVDDGISSDIRTLVNVNRGGEVFQEQFDRVTAEWQEVKSNTKHCPTCGAGHEHWSMENK